MPDSVRHDVRFGDEGQGWSLMTEAEFLQHPKVVPDFQDRLAALGGAAFRRN